MLCLLSIGKNTIFYVYTRLIVSLAIAHSCFKQSRLLLLIKNELQVTFPFLFFANI